VRTTILATTCGLLLAFALPAAAQARPAAVAANRTDGDLRALDSQIDQMVRSRDLRVRDVMRDAFLDDRRHERFDQYYRGVRIVGGDVTRQSAADGTVSVFGMIHTGLDLSTAPGLTIADGRAAITKAVTGPAMNDPELVVLPLSDGYHLAYYAQAIDSMEIVNVYVDASTGAVLRKYTDYRNEVGSGKGTYGDDKKVSAKAASGTFMTDDPLRPAAITTYDMKGNFGKTTSVLNRFTNLTTSDIAADSDNVWTDSTVVDAHVYTGWYYDYLFRRFNRHGLDDKDLRMVVLTHPVNLTDIFFQPSSVIGLYYLNAFFCSTCGPDGKGAITFGEGAPRGFVGPNIEVKPFSAALDVVAHELTHGVTAATSNLNGFPYSEAGALNEAFSDMIGLSTAFFYEPTGTGALKASYVVGRDLSEPNGAFAIRDIANPFNSRDPDHYTGRIIGGDPHFNSTIASHAFFLAIEGGTNRTSGRTVQGVGANNRDQIEKAFFRALTLLMPSSSTFALTRVATIQAARDLFGLNSTAERAITQAWDAVGVQPRVDPTAAVNPDPSLGQSSSCGVPSTPNWIIALTASAGTSNLRVQNWTLSLFDSNGDVVLNTTNAGSTFGQAFNQCGPGSTQLSAQSDACAAFCVGLGGQPSGRAQFSFTALDDSGRTLTTTSNTVTLAPPR
jgi:Zn-dependent metalloprotease